MTEKTEKKGRWQRFLERLAKSNEKQFGGKPLSCCGQDVSQGHGVCSKTRLSTTK